MQNAPRFPEELLLHEADRGRRLISEFYEQYEARPQSSKTKPYKAKSKQDPIKAAFYRKNLQARSHDQNSFGLDVGCRGGVMIELVNLINWIGIDLDRNALTVARESGIACQEMDFTSSIDFRENSFDVVMMTEVL